MPYNHSGEIGDVWKHLPLCDLLNIEKPKRYFETNSAFAKYELKSSPTTDYGIFHLLKFQESELLQESAYLQLLESNGFEENHIYLGSPGLAIMLLSGTAEQFYFHDIEPEPLQQITRFAMDKNLRDKVKVVQGDSISSFLHGDYRFGSEDFIHIDPYEPFAQNEAGEMFFDIFLKAYISGAKVLFWYGYDNLAQKSAIVDAFESAADKYKIGRLATYDVWQKCMTLDGCDQNPGVPGCGVAAANVSESSYEITEKYLRMVGELYQAIEYHGKPAPLCLGYNSF